VIVRIGDRNLTIRPGGTVSTDLLPNQALKVLVERPDRTFPATEFLLIDSSGGDVRIQLEGDKSSFTYETPSERQLRMKLAAESARQRQEEANQRAIREAESVRQAEQKRQEEANQRAAEMQKFLNPEMVSVRGGTFTMGCTSDNRSDCGDYEWPAHLVTLSDFQIGKYEVTQGQWEAVMGNNPNTFSGCPSCPVEDVSWNEVQEFIRKLNALTGKRYRLPTEAEWEYAARGGNQSRGYKYSGSNDPGSVAWYEANSEKKIHPVGQKSPNELGIYDMSGNIMEWCEDQVDNYSRKNQTNPLVKSIGTSQIFRGGHYRFPDSWARVSFRHWNGPDDGEFGGFRLAL
jgi:formylglycine-generating enzyme required for sulfatase activity